MRWSSGKSAAVTGLPLCEVRRARIIGYSVGAARPSLAMNARIALHVRTLYGRDPHHITEAQYKAVARALRQAVEYDPRVTGVPSTKGTL